RSGFLLRFGSGRGRLAVTGVRLVLLRAVAEIGDVPTASLELERRRAQPLVEGLGTAVRADVQRGIGELLQHVLLDAAAVATIGVNRHGARNPRMKAARPGSGNA